MTSDYEIFRHIPLSGCMLFAITPPQSVTLFKSNFKKLKNVISILLVNCGNSYFDEESKASREETR